MGKVGLLAGCGGTEERTIVSSMRNGRSAIIRRSGRAHNYRCDSDLRCNDQRMLLAAHVIHIARLEWQVVILVGKRPRKVLEVVTARASLGLGGCCGTGSAPVRRLALEITAAACAAGRTAQHK